MSEETKSTRATTAKDSPKTMAGNVKSKVVFENTVDAAAYLNRLATDFSDFGDHPLIAPGIDADGNFDPTIYHEGVNTVIAILNRAGGLKKGSKTERETGIKAIVIYPAPKVSALLESQAGIDFVDKIISKELNHIAVRALRDAENPASVADQVPTTIDGFLASGRESNAGMLETFNALWSAINKFFAAKVPAWSRARLSKQDLRRAMESTGFATEYYVALERRGDKGESLFATAAKLGVSLASKKGLDPEIFQRWLDTRDSMAFSPETTGDDEDQDFSDIASIVDDLLGDGPADTDEDGDSTKDLPIG